MTARRSRCARRTVAVVSAGLAGQEDRTGRRHFPAVPVEGHRTDVVEGRSGQAVVMGAQQEVDHAAGSPRGTNTRTYGAAGQQQDRSPGDNGALPSSRASACAPERAGPPPAAARSGVPDTPKRIHRASSAGSGPAQEASVPAATDSGPTGPVWHRARGAAGRDAGRGDGAPRTPQRRLRAGPHLRGKRPARQGLRPLASAEGRGQAERCRGCRGRCRSSTARDMDAGRPR